MLVERNQIRASELLKEVCCKLEVFDVIALVDGTALNHISQVNLVKLQAGLLRIEQKVFESFILDISKYKIHQAVEKVTKGSESIKFTTKHKVL